MFSAYSDNKKYYAVMKHDLYQLAIMAKSTLLMKFVTFFYTVCSIKASSQCDARPCTALICETQIFLIKIVAIFLRSDARAQCKGMQG